MNDDDEETYGLYPSVNPRWLDAILNCLGILVVYGIMFGIISWWTAI